MIIFGFGTFRPKTTIQSLLVMIAAELQTGFGVNVQIRSLDEPADSQVDLVLIDVSKQLQSLHVSGLGKVHRLFVFQTGPTKLTEGLERFFQSLSALHGKPVKLIFDQKRTGDNVYQIDTVMKHTAVGFHMGDSTNPTDLSELASALFQEYYALRIHEIRDSRIEHIIEHLASQAIQDTQRQIAAAGQTEVSNEAAPSHQHAAIPDAAGQFLNNVLRSLDVPFRVKFLFFRYITMRISMGQPLQDAVTDLLPMVMEHNAFEQMSLQMKVEMDVFGPLEQRVSQTK